MLLNVIGNWLLDISYHKWELGCLFHMYMYNTCTVRIHHRNMILVCSVVRDLLVYHVQETKC